MNPVSKNAVRWIYDNNAAGTFFGTPYGNVGRNPGLRGPSSERRRLQHVQTTKVTERLSLRLEHRPTTCSNHMFLGFLTPLSRLKPCQ